MLYTNAGAVKTERVIVLVVGDMLRERRHNKFIAKHQKSNIGSLSNDKKVQHQTAKSSTQQVQHETPKNSTPVNTLFNCKDQHKTHKNAISPQCVTIIVC